MDDGTVPAALEALMKGDELLTAVLFATVAGLALTASAFAFTAGAYLEESASRLRSGTDFLTAKALSEESGSVLGAGMSMI